MYESYFAVSSTEEATRKELRRVAEGDLEVFVEALRGGALTPLLQPVGALELSRECENALKDAGFQYVGHVSMRQRSYFLRTPLLKPHLQELHHALKAMGCDIGRFTQDPVSRYLGITLALWSERSSEDIVKLLLAEYAH